MKWLWLILAGIFEVTWAFMMKLSNGFTEITATIITIVGYIASAVFLSLALKQLPLGTAYAMWTGFGIIGTTVLGVVMFHEKLSPMQIMCVILIVIGVVGLKLLTKE